MLMAARPVHAQCPDGSPPPCRSVPGRAAPAANSIAVLYFDNLSRDTGDVYLADGFTEEVMSRLGQVERLAVKSRTAVQTLRGRPHADPIATGRSLGVAHLVSGSVMRAGNRVRVTVELTRVTNGNSVWARSFDRSASDLIGTEAEIAESVAVNVGQRLAPSERRAIEARPTRNAEAYDHWLRANFEEERATSAGYLRAVQELQQAVALDSTYAGAWAQLAEVSLALAGIYYSPDIGISRDTLVARSRAAAEHALRLDSTSVDAWLARAATRPPRDAVLDLARAAALSPSAADPHHTYALQLRMLGHDSEALSEFRRALEIEPGRVITIENVGQTYMMLRNYAEAAHWLDSSVALRPEAAFMYLEDAFVHLLTGDTARARRLSAEVSSRGNHNGEQEILAMLEARAGDTAGARLRMQGVEASMSGRDCVVSHDCLEVAIGLVAVGEPDRAIAMLEREMPHEAWLAYWMTRPEFDAIRSEPRYQRLLQESRAATLR